MTAKWPTTVATDADLFVAVNALATTLSGGIDNVVATIPLTSTTGFPTAGAVDIDQEIIFYTGVSGGSLTGCIRGSDGTLAASHTAGVPVSASLVAFHHNGLMAEIEAIEAWLTTSIVANPMTSDLNANNHKITGLSMGSASDAAISFTGDPDTGIFSGALNNFNLVTNGVSKLTVGATALYPLVPLLAINGTGAVPAYSFDNDPDSGFYSGAANDVYLSLGGAGRYTFLIDQMRVPEGTVALPGICFGSDTNTGFSHTAPDNMQVSINGAKVVDYSTTETNFYIAGVPKLSLSNTFFQIAVQLEVVAGSAAAPALSFALDPDTGIYNSVANYIEFATQGTRRAYINTTDFVSTVPLTVQAQLVGKGTTTNDSASAGYIGEVIASVSGASTMGATDVWQDMTSISLTAGDWDVSLMVNFAAGAANTAYYIGISTSSGSSFPDGGNDNYTYTIFPSGGYPHGLCIPIYRKSLSSTTTIYAKIMGTYTGAAMNGRGVLTARRVR